MNQQIVEEIKRDFLEWSGGFSPESPEQVSVYVDYARNGKLDAEVVRNVLNTWMAQDGAANAR